MVTCKSDISFPLIKLSHYSAALAREPFKALQVIYNYQFNTINKGIYYRRYKLRTDTKDGSLPSCSHINKYEPQTYKQTEATNVRATVDSNYADDTSHQHSVNGITMKIAGGGRVIQNTIPNDNIFQLH